MTWRCHWATPTRSSWPNFLLMILLLLLLFSILPVSRSVVPYIIKCVTEPLSESLYDLAGKRREVKSKGDKERYKPLNAEFQRTARRDKQAFLSDQCKEIEENNRMGKTMEWGSWHCTGDRHQDHPHGKEMQKSKMAVWGGLTNSCEKKRSQKQRILKW